MLLAPLIALLAVPAEIQSLLDRAALLPPELHADTILRVLEAGKIMAPMLREEQRRTTKWEASLRAFLNDLERWRQRDPEPLAAWFHQRLITARALLDIIPEGPLRREVWGTSMRFLADSPLYRESPAEWCLQAEYFLKQPDAQTVLPGLADGRLAVLADAGRLLGPRKPD